MFDEVARLTPSQMYLDRFERKDNKFTFQGRAESPNTVSEFLRNLESSPWFRNAFMNSYTGVDAQQKQPSGSVLPRPEDNYGSFVVTVDISDEAASLEPVVIDGTTNLVAPATAATGGQ